MRTRRERGGGNDVKKVVLGVDPSLTNTGIVVLSAETGNLVGCWDSKKAQAMKLWHKQSREVRNSPIQQGYRLKVIGEYLGRCVQRYGYIWAAYEDYSYESEHRAFALGELGGVLKANISDTCIDLHLISPKQLKKFATGYGNADKKSLQEKAAEECRALPKKASNDICDAYFLAKAAWYRYFPENVLKQESHKELLRSRLEIAAAK